MDIRLQLLETFLARGSDGATYKVHAYDRLAPDAALADGDHWISTGVAEYRLEDGRQVDVRKDGSLCIARTDIGLTPQQPQQPQQPQG